MRHTSHAPNTMDAFVTAFVAALRDQAALLRGYGAGEASATCERIAADLEGAFRSWWTADLSVPEASDASGYSADRLRELVREGRIPDSRGPEVRGEIRLRRSDLPRRPRAAAPSPAVNALATQVLPGRR